MGWRDEARERVKEKQQGNTIKLVEGANCLRIIPNKKDLMPDGNLNPKGILHKPYVEFRVHRNVGPDKVLCGCGIDIEGKGACWLCQRKLPELEGTNVRSKVLRAQEMQVQEQFLVQASRFDPDTQKFTPPKPWWVSTGSGIPGRSSQSLAVRVHGKIAGSKKDYIDPVKGYNLNVERTGTSMKTRYPDVEGDDAPSKVPLPVLAAAKPLSDFVPRYDEEAMKAAYFGRPKEQEAETEAADTTEEDTGNEESTEAEEEEYSAESEEEPEPEPESDPESEEEPATDEEYEPEPEPEPESEPAPRRPAPKPPARPAGKPDKAPPPKPPAKPLGKTRR